MNFFFPTRTGKKGDEMKNKQTHNFVQRGNKNRLDLVQPNPRCFLTETLPSITFTYKQQLLLQTHTQKYSRTTRHVYDKNI